MKLKQLIKSLDGNISQGNLNDFEVRGIACNSKEVFDNYVFVAIEGTREDGHRFIDEAVRRRAGAVIIRDSRIQEIGSSRGVSFIGVEDTRKALSKLAAAFYGDPSNKIKVVGITGTNGKTTVAYLIEAVLKEANSTPAVIGTINYRFNDKVFAAKNTTPGPIELQSMLRQMQNQGVDYAIMEVSSHALDQERVKDINFHSAIFTNLSQDHLDYHKTIENYFEAKSKLFNRVINTDYFSVINQDDPYGLRLKKLATSKIVSYGIEVKSDVMAKDIKFDITHTHFVLTYDKRETDFTTRLIGRHNIYNILASVSWALKEGLDIATIKAAIERFTFVPGRLERVDSGGDFLVFVDYAHTDNALENVIKSLRQLSCRRIIVVFGCGGERDQTKRPKMGRVVSELADYAIITNDNPRSEDPREIINDIKKGMIKNNYCVIMDRLEAIKKSLSLAESGDIVLIAGKGHENYQILKNRKISFDDREAVRECLKSLSC